MYVTRAHVCHTRYTSKSLSLLLLTGTEIVHFKGSLSLPHRTVVELNPSSMQLNYYLPVNADILEYSNCTPLLGSMAETMLGGLTGLPRWFGPTVRQRLASL